MADTYCPFMGRKGRSWGELDLPTIAGRVAGGVPPEVEAAVQGLATACRAAGLSPERAKVLLEEAFSRPVSAPPSRRTRR